MQKWTASHGGATGGAGAPVVDDDDIEVGPLALTSQPSTSDMVRALLSTPRSVSPSNLASVSLFTFFGAIDLYPDLSPREGVDVRVRVGRDVSSIAVQVCTGSFPLLVFLMPLHSC